MKFFKSLTAKKQIAERQQQMEAFVKTLRDRNEVDLGFVLLLVTHIRHQVKAEGYDMLLTNMQYELNQQVCGKLSTLMHEYHSRNLPAAVYACKVWVYTMNAALAMDMRSLGRQMWRELRRGTPHVQEHVERATHMLGEEPEISNYDKWPQGF